MNTSAPSLPTASFDLAILHADEDAAVAQRLASAALAQGWQLAWQPPATPTGATLSAALNASRVVCVLWSAPARSQEWVCDRAARALLREALLAVNLDPSPPPPGLGGATPLNLPPDQDAAGPVVLAALQAALLQAHAPHPGTPLHAGPALATAAPPAGPGATGLFKLVLGRLRGQGPATTPPPARALLPEGPMPVDDRFERTIPVQGPQGHPPALSDKAPDGSTGP